MSSSDDSSIVVLTDTDEEDFDPRFGAGDFKKLLDDINPPGEFATAGAFDPPALSPTIVVEGVGTIGLPLHPVMANLVKEKAAAAGANELDLKRVTVTGDKWTKAMKELVDTAAFELGISNMNVAELGIEAKLRGILFFQGGGCQIEVTKGNGVFGSLLVRLPGQFSGGASIVAHSEKGKKKFDLEKDGESSFGYVASYSDCQHEILPITEGSLFCLAYDLVVTNQDKLLRLPSSLGRDNTTKELQIQVAKWLASSTGNLGFPLKHKYKSGRGVAFGFDSLEGHDASVVSALRSAVDNTGARLFDLALAILEYAYSPFSFGQEFSMGEIVLENGTKRFSSLRWKYDGILYASENLWWCERAMFVMDGKDGFLTEWDEISEDEIASIRDGIHSNMAECCLIGAEENDVRIEADDISDCRCTWRYEAPCLIIRPASGTSLSSTVAALCGDSGPLKKKQKCSK